MPSIRLQTNLLLQWLPAWLLIVALTNPLSLAAATLHADPGSEQEQGGDMGWREVKPTGARASIEMPRRPRYVERFFTPVVGRAPIKVRLHLATSKDGKASFILSYHDLAEKPTGKTIESTLEGAVRGTLATVLGKLESQGSLKYEKYRGKQFLYTFRQIDRENKNHDFAALSRVYLVNKRQYQLSVVMEYDSYNKSLADAERFLNSFQLIESPPDLPPVPRIRK